MSPHVFDLEKYYRECYGPALSVIEATTLSSYLLSIITNYTPSLLLDCSAGPPGSYVYNLNNNVINLFIVVGQKYRIGSGTYGNVYKCKRNGSSVLVKIQKGSVTAQAEPFIQWACHWILDYYGLKWAIPRVYDIVEHSSYGVVFTMEDIADGVLFGHYLNDNLDLSRISKANDIVVLQTIAQLALYMLLLEKDLGLWHRDLKANNILMVRKTPIKDFQVAIDDKLVVLNSSYQTIMVDFGCSSIEGLTANPKFPTIENYKDCGRDLFIIFSNIMNNFRIRQCFTEKLWGLFKNWLVYTEGTSKQSNWINILLNDEDPYLERAYNIVNRQSFCASNAIPMRVLEDIAKNYPSILRLEVA